MSNYGAGPYCVSLKDRTSELGETKITSKKASEREIFSPCWFTPQMGTVATIGTPSVSPMCVAAEAQALKSFLLSSFGHQQGAGS